MSKKSKKPMRTIKPSARTGIIPRKKVDTIVRGIHVTEGNGKWEVGTMFSISPQKSFTSKSDAVVFAQKQSKQMNNKVFVHEE